MSGDRRPPATTGVETSFPRRSATQAGG